MVKENTAGAPTEGLGQTVTFGFTPQAPQTSRGVQRGGIRAGVQGSAASPIALATGATIQPNPAVDLLMKVGSQLIDKQIKEARTRSYVSGMQRAMNGEAVEDIAAKQPAWSRVFGDSDAVEGARAYSAERKVQDTLLSIEQDMPNIRQLGPKEANEFFVKSVNAALTGHAATDHAIMTAVQRNLPGVMKRHATAHYAYMQEEAANQEAGALESAATRLQQAGVQLAKGEITAEDFAEQQASVSMLSVPAAGRDPEWVTKQRTAGALLMAERGQFHALNAMEKIGLFDSLPPANKAQIFRARQANEGQWKSAYSQEFAGDLAALKVIDEDVRLGNRQGWTPAKTMQVVSNINKMYKERTGSQTDYFNGEIVAAYGEQTAKAIAALHNEQVAENKRAADAARVVKDKAAEAQAIESGISMAAAQGKLSSSLSIGLIADNDAERWFLPRATQAISDLLAGKPNAFKMVIDNAVGGYTSKALKNNIGVMVNGSVSGGAMTPSFASTFELWRKTNEASPEAAAAYFGDSHAKFQRSSLVHPGRIETDPKRTSPFLHAAFAGSFGPGAKRFGTNIDKAQFAELVKKSAEVGNSGKWLPEMLGGDNKLRPGQAEVIANGVRHRAEVLADSTTMEQAMHSAITVGSQNDMRIVGGYAWEDPKGRDVIAEVQAKLGTRFGLSSKLEASQDFGEVMDEEIAKAGGMKNPRVQRLDDALIVTDIVDGVVRNAYIPVNAVAERLMQKGQQRRGKNPDGTTKEGGKFGPKLTALPDPDMPSPYASPEVWKAYRAKQAK